MKKMKRLVAVLLAAVMALAMLTACGGGGSGSSANSTEATVVNALNTTWGTHYGNDAALKAKVRATLQKVDENGMIKVSDLPTDALMGPGFSDVNIGENGDASFVMYLMTDGSTSSNTAVKAIEVTPEFLKQMEDAKPSDSKPDVSMIKAIGVSTFTASNGKTYIGFAFKMAGNTKTQ